MGTVDFNEMGGETYDSRLIIGISNIDDLPVDFVPAPNEQFQCCYSIVYVCEAAAIMTAIHQLNRPIVNQGGHEIGKNARYRPASSAAQYRPLADQLR